MVDHFRVLRLIGRGGMGEIYLARDTRLGRKVALKVVRSSLGESPTARERFFAEARATATFNHPHIVTIYDVGEHAGAPYVALEYLEGQTLRQRLGEDPPSLRDALRIGLAIAQALAEAHRHGVLHLDLKPDNVLIPKDGRLRVVDFGLAHLAGTAPDTDPIVDPALDEGATQSKAFGTPAYMAPELWNHDVATAAADIWSLGTVLFEMVVGRHPLHGIRSAAEIEARLQAETTPDVRSARDVPAPLAELIAHTLDREAARRPGAGEVAAVLESLLGRPRITDDERGPFRGLFAFAERHADTFFGRDAEIAAAVERLREQPILAVVGRSGAGKSSFVQAGIVPRLREQAPWHVITIRPGAHPLRALALRLLEDAGPTVNLVATTGTRPRALEVNASASNELVDTLRIAPARLGLMLQDLAESTERRVLLFVDQLEEVVTLTEDAVERDAFLRALCTAADDAQAPVRVAFTVRDDFLSRLAETPEVRDVLQNVVVLRNLSGDALTEVLRRPLEAAGYSFDDPKLPSDILAAVQGEQATLPILQFTLQMMWERRDRTRHLFQRATYEAIGGVAGALAAHADEVLAGLSETQLAAARDLLLRLVSGEGTRRTVAEAEALAGLPADAPAILERLTQSRLISSRKSASGRGVEYELAHESLIQSWTRLRRWLEESRGELRTLDETAQAAELWRRRDRRPELLWSGDALREARRAAQHAPARLTPPLREFLDAATAREEALASEAAQRRARAEAESARAALARGDLLHARAQLRSSLELADSSEGRSLWWQLDQGSLVWRRSFGSSVTHCAFSPDGARIVATSEHNLYVLDAETLETRVLRGHTDSTVSCAFSPDGKALASGTWSGQLGLWDVESGAVRFAKEHTDSVWRVVFLQRKPRLLTASVDHRITLWDLDTLTVLRRYERHEAGVYGLALHPDEEVAVSGGVDARLCWWDVEAGTLIREQTMPGGGIRDVSFSPDGKVLAVGMSDATIHLVDGATGATLLVLRGHTGPLHRALFSPDGRLVASSSIDQTIRVWDAHSGATLEVLRGHGSLVRGLAFSPDGTHLVSTSYDKTLRLWRLGGHARAVRHRGHSGGIEGLAYSPAGTLIATGSQDRTVRLWDPQSGRVVHVLAGHEGNIGNVHFSADGKRVASACNDGTCRIWDTATGHELMRLSAGTDRVCAVAFHPAIDPEGGLLATGHGDGSVRLWDLATATVRFHHKAHPSDCRWVQFAPHGHVLASTAHDDAVIIFWEVATGRELRRLAGHQGGVVGVDFSKDERRLVSAGFDETLRLWDLASGEGTIVGRHRSRVYKAMFHADQHHVATASADATARLWDLADGSYVEFAGHASEVNAAKLSPDGAYLATASDDFTLRHWDTRTGRPHWRCPYVSEDGIERFTHRGWQRSDGAPIANPDAAWRCAVAERARVCTIEGPLLAIELWDQGKGRRFERWSRQDDRLVESGTFVDDAGSDTTRTRGEVGVTCTLVTDSATLVGFSDGAVELRGAEGRTAALDATPPSAVRRLLLGPMRTVFVGYASGFVGMWSLDTRTLLYEEQLHGAVAHLRWRAGHLVVATELGDDTDVDFSVFDMPYEDLRRVLQTRIRVVWENGAAIRRLPPSPDIG